MAYTMKHTLIAAIALLALSMAVVARPEKADCAETLMSKDQEGLEHPDPEIECFITNSCSPTPEEAELALNLLSGTPGTCCHSGKFPNCNTPVISPNSAIYVCGDTRQACQTCKEVADSLRPVLKDCERGDKVDGIVREGSLSFAISKNPANQLCTRDEM